MVQGGKSLFYDWKVDEEVYLVIFNKQEVKIDQYSNSRTPVGEEAAQKREEEKVGLDNIDLGNLSRLSPKLKRAYERYFGGAERPAQFHRLDKLKVYDILSLGQ